MSDRYQHVQETPSDRWVVQHNLFTRAPIVDAYVDFDNQLQKMLPVEVVVVDQTQCHIVWSVPRTGRAGVI